MSWASPRSWPLCRVSVFRSWGTRPTWPGRHPWVHLASAKELGAAGGSLLPLALQDSGLDRSWWVLPRRTREEPLLRPLCPRWVWGILLDVQACRDRRASPQLGPAEARGGPCMPRSLHKGRTPGSWGRAHRTRGPGASTTIALFTCRSHNWLDVGVEGPGMALAGGQGCRLPLASPGQPADRPSGFSGF